MDGSSPLRFMALWYILALRHGLWVSCAGDFVFVSNIASSYAYGLPSQRYRFYPNKSEDIVDHFQDEEFDLIFVDGPHTYRNVAVDILVEHGDNTFLVHFASAVRGCSYPVFPCLSGIV